ncbi:Uu.00g122630.m01.CDS01 [Anthostomella pinea]|uniref:Uu.00g122630.m01.CDS01 n=1 Tax=Anthostomella pinea TaxID=933095 RepID=A0AAI8VI93_9PEZI|nr:Uu.00g122630.m01.CDS01 [Anthostomella pinea]
MRHSLIASGLVAVARAHSAYDFIIVGGGTAGVVVSTRLSQTLPDCSVLVIEAGPDERDLAAISIPGLEGVLGTKYDWNFTTTPQPGANNLTITMNQGKLLGGSSALNLLSYDRATNTAVNGSAGLVGMGVGEAGPIHFLVNHFSPAQQEAFFPTMQNLGWEQTYSFLDGDMLGWMRHTSNILDVNYTRSYSPAFLSIAPSNLEIMVNTTVAN